MKSRDMATARAGRVGSAHRVLSFTTEDTETTEVHSTRIPRVLLRHGFTRILASFLRKQESRFPYREAHEEHEEGTKGHQPRTTRTTRKHDLTQRRQDAENYDPPIHLKHQTSHLPSPNHKSQIINRKALASPARIRHNSPQRHISDERAKNDSHGPPWAGSMW